MPISGAVVFRRASVLGTEVEVRFWIGLLLGVMAEAISSWGSSDDASVANKLTAVYLLIHDLTFGLVLGSLAVGQIMQKCPLQISVFANGYNLVA